jgi:hypothetical protein
MICDADRGLDLFHTIGRNRSGGNAIGVLVPERRIGIAVHLDVRVGREDPVFAEGAFELGESGRKISRAYAGRNAHERSPIEWLLTAGIVVVSCGVCQITPGIGENWGAVLLLKIQLNELIAGIVNPPRVLIW